MARRGLRIGDRDAGELLAELGMEPMNLAVASDEDNLAPSRALKG